METEPARLVSEPVPLLFRTVPGSPLVEQRVSHTTTVDGDVRGFGTRDFGLFDVGGARQRFQGTKVLILLFPVEFVAAPV